MEVMKVFCGGKHENAVHFSAAHELSASDAFSILSNCDAFQASRSNSFQALAVFKAFARTSSFVFTDVETASHLHALCVLLEEPNLLHPQARSNVRAICDRDFMIEIISDDGALETRPGMSPRTEEHALGTTCEEVELALPYVPPPRPPILRPLDTQRLNERGHRNWLRLGMAIKEVTHALQLVIHDKAQEFHRALLAEMEMRGVRAYTGEQSMYKPTMGFNDPEQSALQPWADAIARHHLGQRPSWSNSDARKWCSEAGFMEVMKVFCGRMGKHGVEKWAAHELPASALLAILLLYDKFKARESAAEHRRTGLVRAASKIERAWRQNPTFLDVQTNENLQALCELLENEPNLAPLPAVQEALGSLRAICDGDLSMVMERQPKTTSLGMQYISFISATGLRDCMKRVMAQLASGKISQIRLRGEELAEVGAKALVASLQDNRTVTVLDLGSNAISDEGAAALAEMLQHNSMIATLNLAHNRFGDEGVKALAASLQDNRTVTVLDLSSNAIMASGEGAAALAEMLQHNSTIATLNLAHNRFGDEGAKSLAEMLQHNSTIATLNLANNRFGDEGAKSLAAGGDRIAFLCRI
jgi:hypothetical protein